MSSHIYQLNVRSQGVCVDVRVNDCTIEYNRKGDPRGISLKINQWIIEGENTVTIQAARPLADGNLDPLLKVELQSSPHGVESEASRQALVQYTWNDSEQPVPRGVMTAIHETSFTPDVTFGRWRWEDADVVDLDEEEKERIVKFIKQVRDHLARRDIDAIAKIYAQVNNELERAWGCPVNSLQTVFLDTLRKMFRDPGFSIAPIASDLIELRPQANGRMVQALRVDGEQVLSMRSGAGGMSLNVYLARLGGRWEMVR